MQDKVKVMGKMIEGYSYIDDCWLANYLYNSGRSDYGSGSIPAEKAAAIVLKAAMTGNTNALQLVYTSVASQTRFAHAVLTGALFDKTPIMMNTVKQFLVADWGYQISSVQQ
jgi:hypothetical protein